MLRDSLSFTQKSKREIQAIEQKIDGLSWGFEYGEVFSLKKGIQFKLGNAGHIFGSCFVWFEISLEHQKDDYRVLFSGDLGCTDTPILPDPDIPDACDLLIMESTYGDRNHESRKKRIEVLKNCLARALADGGIVYIPAFSLGRTQEFDI